MVFAVTLDFKNKINDSILKEVEKTAKYLANSYVESGVIDEDERTSRMAHESEFGKWAVYDWGPYAGEDVHDHPRPFVSAPINQNEGKLKDLVAFFLMNNFNTNSAKVALRECGEEMSRLQTESMTSKGATIGGWEQFSEDGDKNCPRTIATKGFDFPLLDRYHNPFPITNRIATRSSK